MATIIVTVATYVVAAVLSVILHVETYRREGAALEALRPLVLAIGGVCVCGGALALALR